MLGGFVGFNIFYYWSIEYNFYLMENKFFMYIKYIGFIKEIIVGIRRLRDICWGYEFKKIIWYMI